MTIVSKNKSTGIIGTIISEGEGKTIEDIANSISITWSYGLITDDLRIGADTTKAISLRANEKLCNQGCKIAQKRRKSGESWAQGFLVDEKAAVDLGYSKYAEYPIIRRYIAGDDITNTTRNAFVIDFYGLNQQQSQEYNALAYQRILEQVKPFREQSNDKLFREKWWLFGRPRPQMREANQGLNRYIITSEVSKHRVFIFIDYDVLSDGSCFTFSFEDGYFLGVLSSIIHTHWVITTGGRMGVANDPRYNNTVCFDPFPFPDPTLEQKQKIRELGDRLDSHRKQVQAAHPDITITGMYNLLEKLRAGTPFSDIDRAYNNRALVSTLKQIHDELDKAVFEAYGWQDLSGKPTAEIDETILERLVALNAERAAEERNGHIRWLRPEYQAPAQTQSTQITLTGIDVEPETVVIPVEQQKWPTLPKAQLAAIRDLLRTSSGEWTVAQIANQFTGKNTQKKLDAISENLDRLEWFGVVIDREDTGIVYWQYAELQQTA